MATHPASSNPQGGIATSLDRLDGLLARSLTYLAQRPVFAGLVLLGFALAAFLPGLFDLPPIDRTEIRYAQTSKQMLETGDLLRPSFQAEPQLTKPFGVFWLQSATAGLLGVQARSAIWAYRLPSLAGALLAVLFTFFGARRYFGREAAFLGALLLAVNIIVVLQAHLALTKALHLAFVVAAQWSLARLYIDERDEKGRRDALIFWVAQGGGILTGVLALPLLSLATIAGLVLADREAGWLNRLCPLWGLPLMVLVASPWIAVLIANPDLDLVRQAWGQGLLDKLAGPQEMNWRGFPGMYALGLWLGLLPGAAFFFLAAQRTWRRRDERPCRFLLAWVVTYLAAIEFLSAKPPLYTLQMLMPALTVALAMALVQGGEGAKNGIKPGRACAALALLHALLPGTALLALLWLMGPPARPLVLVLTALVLAAAAVAIIAACRARPFVWAGLSIAAGILFYIAALELALPNFERVWTSQRLVQSAGAIEPCAPGPFAVAGYSEPSAVFTLGTATFIAKGPNAGALAAQWLVRGIGHHAFVSDGMRVSFETHIERSGFTPPRAIACVGGLNIGRFKWVTLRLYTTVPGQTMAACPMPAALACEPH